MACTKIEMEIKAKIKYRQADMHLKLKNKKLKQH